MFEESKIVKCVNVDSLKKYEKKNKKIIRLPIINKDLKIKRYKNIGINSFKHKKLVLFNDSFK